MTTKENFLLKYPCHILYHLLKENVTYNDIRMLHAILGCFNELKVYNYYDEVTDEENKILHRIPITGIRLEEKHLKSYITSDRLKEEKSIAKSINNLQDKNFTVMSYDTDKDYWFVTLVDDRNPYRYIPFKVIDEYNTKNTLAIKIHLWLCVMQKRSLKRKDGNFHLRISVHDFVNNYFWCLKKYKASHTIREIRDAIEILSQGKMLVKFFEDEIKYLNFSWKVP